MGHNFNFPTKFLFLEQKKSSSKFPMYLVLFICLTFSTTILASVPPLSQFLAKMANSNRLKRDMVIPPRNNAAYEAYDYDWQMPNAFQ